LPVLSVSGSLGAKYAIAASTKNRYWRSLAARQMEINNMDNMYQVYINGSPTTPAAYGRTAAAALRWWKASYPNRAKRGGKYTLRLLSKGNPCKRNALKGYIPCKAVKIVRNRGRVEIRLRGARVNPAGSGAARNPGLRLGPGNGQGGDDTFQAETAAEALALAIEWARKGDWPDEGCDINVSVVNAGGSWLPGLHR
jgi:hypothetical protein